MNIKEKIGRRIKEERLAKGLTRKALAEMTVDLKISRINNYERGERTPGPMEIQQLAKALEVSPAFLMCLSDDRQGKLKKTPGLGALIPILNHQQATQPILHLETIKDQDFVGKVDLIPLSPHWSAQVSENAFAIEVHDDSMNPEFRNGDILIVDVDTFPSPGDFVVAKLDEQEEVIIRKYRQLSAAKKSSQYELIALNDDWANIRVGSMMNGSIIGTIIGFIRNIKS